jgi:hypothetical protein
MALQEGCPGFQKKDPVHLLPLQKDPLIHPEYAHPKN